MRVDGVRECCRGLHAVDATLPREDTSLRRRRHDRVPSQVFTLSVLELFHGWKIYDYLIYTRYRFLQRETRWKGLEDSLDECIDESVRMHTMLPGNTVRRTTRNPMTSWQS